MSAAIRLRKRLLVPFDSRWNGFMRGATARLEGVDEKIIRWVAWRLPHRIVYYAAIRVWAHATTGKWSDQNVVTLTISDAIGRWEPRSMTHYVEIGRRQR